MIHLKDDAQIWCFFSIRIPLGNDLILMIYKNHFSFQDNEVKISQKVAKLFILFDYFCWKWN